MPKMTSYMRNLYKNGGQQSYHKEADDTYYTAVYFKLTEKAFYHFCSSNNEDMFEGFKKDELPFSNLGRP